ncbi:hypothetical protein D3C78_844200 [compost metagenome]
MGHGVLQLAGHLDQAGHDAVGVVAGVRVDVQFAAADGGGQVTHLARFGPQLAQQLAGDRYGQDAADQQGDQAQADHQPDEAGGNGRRGIGVEVLQFFLLLEEAVDAVQPLDIGRCALAQQELAGLLEVAGVAQVDDLAGQRQGLGLGGLDRLVQLVLFLHGAVGRGEHRLQRLGGAGVVAGQALDVGDQGRRVGGAVHQGDVAQGDRPVVHAAAQVQRMLQLDAVDLVGLVEVVLDGADPLYADQGQDQHDGQGGGEAQGQSLADCHSIGFHVDGSLQVVGEARGGGGGTMRVLAGPRAGGLR